jgi:hypothetical protein
VYFADLRPKVSGRKPSNAVTRSSRFATDPLSQQTLQTVSEFLRSVVPIDSVDCPLLQSTSRIK